MGIGESSPASKVSIKGNLSVGDGYSNEQAPADGAIIKGAVGIGTKSPNNASILDLSATDKGILIPRMTSAQRNAISNPTTGLMVYVTDNTTGFWYYDGSSWVQAIGPKGDQGIQGVKGDTGADGADGVQGAKGDTGPAPSGTGIVTVNNGTLQAPAGLTGDVTTSGADLATTIGTGKVTTTKIADNAVTIAKLPSGASNTTFLKGDGTWVTPIDNNTTYSAGTGLNLNGTTFNLANIGTAGTYTKVTTNAQGQVTSGATLAASDIPDLTHIAA